SAESKLVAASLEKKHRRNFLGTEILRDDLAITSELHGYGHGKACDAAIEEKFFGLVPALRFDAQRSGGCLTGSIVVIRAAFARKAGGASWLQPNGVPGNTAVGLLLEAVPVIVIGGHTRLRLKTNRFDALGVRIPFGDEALREGNVHGESGCVVGIEIENGSLHADGAANAGLKIGSLEV